jgi:NAD(P)-dependent dehydrogenase (short-subunit alcohol dehydrogenase family)
MATQQTHQGRVAIVTGAGRGLGRVMALGLAAAGAQVIAVDVDGPVLDQLRAAAHEEGAGDRITAMPTDITRDDAAPAIVQQAVQRFGHLDILVNNAGLNLETVSPNGQRTAGRFWELAPSDYRRILEVNTVAPFLMARAAVAPMMAQKWGRILGVTTSLDTMWRKGMIPYGGSKAAHEALIAAMAEELAGTGVTVNVLVPGGAANTRMTASFGAKQAQLIKPDVMVEPLLWLTTAAADGITGRRFIGALWDKALPGAQAAEKAGAPAAWPQLGRQSMNPA